MKRLHKRASSSTWETSPARRSFERFTPPPTPRRKSREREPSPAWLVDSQSDVNDLADSDDFVPSQESDASSEQDTDWSVRGLDDELDGLGSSSSSSPSSSSDESDVVPRKPKKAAAPRVDHDSRIVVTPRVHSILDPLYPNVSFTVVGQTNVRTSNRPPDKPFNVATAASHARVDASDIVEYAKTRVPDGTLVRVPFYTRVHVDDVCYEVGDFVALQPGQDEHDPRRDLHKVTKQENPWANLWYGKIIYIFAHDDGFSPHATVYTHIRWLEHASKVPVLMEIAHPNCLCVCNEAEESCSDTDAAAILSHADVVVLGKADPDPEPDSMASHQFFVRHGWDPVTVSLSDAQPLLEIGRSASYHGCLSCVRDAESDEPEYHLNDYVYFVSKQRSTVTWSAPYRLGQIVQLGKEEVKVRILGRYDTVLEALKLCIGQSNFDPELSKDETRLFLTDHETMVDRDRLAGIFFVQYKSPEQEWFASGHRFWANTRAVKFPVTSIDDFEPIESGRLVGCRICHDAEEARQSQWNEYAASVKKRPLRGLDLFAGCGGLATAFNRTGFDTKWAVERDEAAVMTARAMHPNTVTVEGDVNDVLHDIASGKVPKGLPSLGDNVDIIFGGPPCQGFSKLNRFRSIDDERNLLFANMLSWVELYRPSYFVLENVEGMVEMDMKLTDGDNETVIGFYILKILVRILTALRYQVRVHFLQAGAYGAPQSRHRLIVIASQCGLPLASVPVPSHSFGKTKAPKGMPGEVQLLMPPGKGCPYVGLTLGDAIGDLPQFDWENPHIVLRASSKQESAERRRAERITAVPCDRGPRGFTKSAKYKYPPLTSFQRLYRGDEPKVSQQYTRGFREQIFERVCNVPLKDGACHKDLPRELVTERLGASSNHRPYGRLSFREPAPIASTTVSPSGATGQVLHPSQHRVLTVREYARIQGFPDWYKFSGNVIQCYRQIGNAVPIPLGVAVAKSIQNSAFKTWLRKGDTAPSPGPSPSPSRSSSVSNLVRDGDYGTGDGEELEVEDLCALSPEPEPENPLYSSPRAMPRRETAPALTFAGVLLPQLDPATRHLYMPMSASAGKQFKSTDAAPQKRREHLVEVSMPTLDDATKAQYHSISESFVTEFSVAATESSTTTGAPVPIPDASPKVYLHALSTTPPTLRAGRAQLLEVAVPSIDAATKALYHPINLSSLLRKNAA